MLLRVTSANMTRQLRWNRSSRTYAKRYRSSHTTDPNQVKHLRESWVVYIWIDINMDTMISCLDLLL